MEQAALVRDIMIEAFAELRDTLQPPSSAYRETLADVVDAMAKGGAVLAWIGSTPVGSARFQLQSNHMYVQRVSVLPEYRGRGIASAMMTYLEDVARELDQKEIQVKVRASLPSNVALYRSLGYTVSGTESHPRGPDTVVSMAKRLTPAPENP